MLIIEKTVWKLGKIKPDIIDDSFKKLSYIKEPFNDPAAVEEWNRVYGKIYDTGEMVDYRGIQPEWTAQIVKEVGLQKSGSSFYRMKPGTILPYHKDAYVKFIKYNKIEDASKIYRALVFLEDWQPGHIFEIDGVPIYNYKSGDYVLWNYDVPHMAANLGPHNRYTLQITGIL
jgi:hypothetical protein